jgi:hypothetical protein
MEGAPQHRQHGRWQTELAPSYQKEGVTGVAQRENQQGQQIEPKVVVKRLEC